MSKRIIEYKIHKEGIGYLKIPYFLEEKDYFFSPKENTLIGLVDKNYQLPQDPSFVELSVDELITRAQATGMNKEDGREMSSEEVKAAVVEWCSVKGVK